MSTLYWSVRRELWENRAVYIAPICVAAVILCGFFVSTMGMPHRRRAVLALDPAQQRAAISVPYDAAAVMLMITSLIVAVFYCLDALYGERRDRSILFWKSLPVSDFTTVLSKAIIPLVVLPVFVFVVILATQLIMLLWSTAVLLPSGLGATTWTRWNFAEQTLILLYGLATCVLWYAPIYALLLFVSAWARRAAFLWAIVPPIAISIFETLAFRTRYFANMVRYRVSGFAQEAFIFDKHQVHSLTQLTPGRFLSTAGLWVGLLFAAIVFVGVVRLRRYRAPI